VGLNGRSQTRIEKIHKGRGGCPPLRIANVERSSAKGKNSRGEYELIKGSSILSENPRYEVRPVLGGGLN